MDKKQNGALGRLIFVVFLATGPAILIAAAAGGTPWIHLANGAALWFGTEFVLGRTFMAIRKEWDHYLAVCGLLLVLVGLAEVNIVSGLVRIFWEASPEAALLTLFGVGILAVWAFLGWTLSQTLQWRWLGREWLPRSLGFLSLPIIFSQLVFAPILWGWSNQPDWMFGERVYLATWADVGFSYLNSVVLQLAAFAFVLGLLALAGQIRNDCCRQTA